MKKLVVVAALLAGAAVAVAQGTPPDEAPDAQPPVAAGPEQTLRERASYAIGYRMSASFKAQGADFDLDQVIQGWKDGAGEGAARFDEQTLDTILRDYHLETLENLKRRGEAWLAENGKREGVQTTASGLQYEVLTAGEGAKPAASDTVVVHYRGTLIDGTEFDSSYRQGEPVTFPVEQVIPGWVEALQLMPVGSKWRLYVPTDLAYGAEVDPRSGIPPNAPLVFEVELLEIKSN